MYAGNRPGEAGATFSISRIGLQKEENVHPGRIDTDLTAAGRLYSHLRRHRGKWIGGWQLTLDTKTTAVSTRISEIRHQLPETEQIEVKQEGRNFFYRWMKVDRESALYEAMCFPGM